MKILIADDHAVIHHGLRRILSDAFAGMVFGEALHSQQALDLAGRESWDLMLLDIDIPIRGGLEVLRHIHSSYPKLPVLMFSMYSEEQFAIRSLKAGASGYLVKNCSSEQLLSAVRRVIRGGRYVSDALAEKLAANLNRVARLVPHEILSDREFQVMRRISAGEGTAEIALALALSPKTVSTYRSRILEKLNLRTTAQLIRYGIEHGI